MKEHNWTLERDTLGFVLYFACCLTQKLMKTNFAELELPVFERVC